MIRKTRSHLVQNEGLVFEESSPGKKAYQLPALDVPEVEAAEALSGNVRSERNRVDQEVEPDLASDPLQRKPLHRARRELAKLRRDGLRRACDCKARH